MKLCLGASVLAVGVSLSTGVRAAVPSSPRDELDLLRVRARARIAIPVTEANDEIEETTVMTIEREILDRLEAVLAPAAGSGPRR